MAKRNKIGIIERALAHHERETKLLEEGKPLYPLFPDMKPKKYTDEEERNMISDYQQKIIMELKERAIEKEYDVWIPKREINSGLFRNELIEINEEIECRKKRLKGIIARKSDLTKYKKKIRENLYAYYKEEYYAFENILPKVEPIIEEEAKKYYELLQTKEKELKNYIQIAEAEKKKIEEKLKRRIKNDE